MKTVTLGRAEYSIKSMCNDFYTNILARKRKPSTRTIKELLSQMVLEDYSDSNTTMEQIDIAIKEIGMYIDKQRMMTNKQKQRQIDLVHGAVTKHLEANIHLLRLPKGMTEEQRQARLTEPDKRTEHQKRILEDL